MDLIFTVRVNSTLAAKAVQLHEISRTGDERRGPHQSLESFLSDLVAVGIVERAELLDQAYPGLIKKPAAREDPAPARIRA